MSTDPVPNSRVRVSDMNDPDPSTSASASASASTVWDWGSLLDFTIYDNDLLTFPGDPSDEDLLIPPPPPPPLHPAAAESPAPAVSNAAGGSKVVRVRKRDPRLVCENFLAGRVPCACPELDAMMLEEEEAADGGRGGWRKRVRKAVEVGVLRCQVEGCEADIRELKGYHRRHRVCLRCANAVAVVMDGEEKRYCQQCGKFHILPDFDEGKRSCRRKLERHNKRRRRRPTDFVSGVEKDFQANLSTEVTFEDKPKEVNGYASETVVGKKVYYKKTLLESEDAQGSPVYSLPESQTMQRDNEMPSTPAEANMDEERDNSKSASTICDNSRNAYSSDCPTGRISFKLYDWNPAEFPRLLRLQIFQWLASMPVELEGYVRPGCTILTIFIAMPQLKWEKLSQDATCYIRDLINAPESLFLGRGNIFIFLGNKIYRVLKDGTSLMNVKMMIKAPRIHYVHPNYFEAGKPIEFFACGSNLDQPNFRFLVSFAGKYTAYDSCAISLTEIMSSDGTEGNSFHNSDHEMFRIRISQTDLRTFGPVFVEVENESGISNFIPILIGNKHICKELERLQVTLTGSLADSLASQIAVHGANPSLCELFIEKQAAMSELIVDIAWLLKEPCPDTNGAILSSINFQRLTSLLKFAIQNELVNILKVILNYFDVMIAGIQESDCVIPDTVPDLLMWYVNCAKEILKKRPTQEVKSELDSEFLREMDILPKSYMKSANGQDEEASSTPCLCSTLASFSPESNENIPLVGKAENEKKHSYTQQQVVNWLQVPRATSSPFKVTLTPLTLFVMVSVVMCFGACLVFLLPTRPEQLVVSIKRGLFGNP